MKTNKPYCYKYPRPAFTVDTLIYDGNKILLIKRKNEPFKGQWALPGGFLDMDETPEEAAIRELQEETDILFNKLIQFKTFGAIDRDPRHRTISTVFYESIKNAQTNEAIAGDDAEETKWFPLDNLPELAFDHSIIISEWKQNVLK